MKCPKCNGKKCEPDNSGDLVWRACKMCHGKGIVPDNNENWFLLTAYGRKSRNNRSIEFLRWKCGSDIRLVKGEA